MLGDDGNQIGTHSALSIPHLNGSFPVFIFGMDDWGGGGFTGLARDGLCLRRADGADRKNRSNLPDWSCWPHNACTRI